MPSRGGFDQASQCHRSADSISNQAMFFLVGFQRSFSKGAKVPINKNVQCSLQLPHIIASRSFAEWFWRRYIGLGSWPDLAASHLARVTAPTLLIVGGADGHVLDLNRAALDGLPACEHELAVVPGATHLFEQTGALEQATELTVGWLTRHLSK